MIRVVADTNVFISALLFGGLPKVFLDLAFLKSFQLIASPALLDELDEKLRLKFRISPEKAALIRSRIEGKCRIIHPAIHLDVIAEDPDDDRVLECAVAGDADYIVTGDKHLLKVGEYRNISIVNVRGFLAAMDFDHA